MRIVRLTNASDLRPLFAFRHSVYVDELEWLKDMGGLLVDEFDGCADNYAAFDDDGSIIGSVRVVPDTPLGLPLERCLPLNGFRDGKRIAEISRLAVASRHRGTKLGALLMKAAYQRCLVHAVSHIMLDTYLDHDDSAPLYERMGFVRVGEAYADTYHLCSWLSASLVLDVAQAHAELPHRHPGLFRYFTTPDPAINHE